MKKLIFLFMLIIACEIQAQRHEKIVMSNPLNLSYRFQTDGVCRRETADPVIILFKDRYYLFASHSSGYWHSSNLKCGNQNTKSSRSMGTRLINIQRRTILPRHGRRTNL